MLRATQHSGNWALLSVPVTSHPARLSSMAQRPQEGSHQNRGLGPGPCSAGPALHAPGQALGSLTPFLQEEEGRDHPKPLSAPVCLNCLLPANSDKTPTSKQMPGILGQVVSWGRLRWEGVFCVFNFWMHSALCTEPCPALSK